MPVYADDLPEILHSANELIAQKGVHNFSLYDIADHAGVASGSVYHFFPNMESVFAALVERYDREFERIVSENIAPEHVNTWGDVLWHHIEKSREYINGMVTMEMQQETYRAMCAYLELYWPKYLPRRSS